jgi:hypothetical protein
MTLQIPAFTAYAEPEPEPDGLGISETDGISGWHDARIRLIWLGAFATPGALQVRVALRLPPGASSVLRLRIGREQHESVVRDGVADFGTFRIESPGYVRLELEGRARTGPTFGDIDALRLSGSAAEGARFNLKERRNAASVHLGYPTEPNEPIVAFYNELTVREEPIWSYYMACGFARGYFGIQVNSLTERRIIFSVWDSGNEAVDRRRVAAENRVALLAKGSGVVAEDFGNEGTGGHSHRVYSWHKGHPYRFLVTGHPDGAATVYSGWFSFPEARHWGLIARFRAPRDGGFLRGLYSFNENFGGANGQRLRRAEFGNGWVRHADGTWRPLTEARFTCDATGRARDREDFAAGVVRDRFFLSNGGGVANGTHFGDRLTRPPGGKAPTIPSEILQGTAAS